VPARVVCISHLTGALGAEIGQAVAARLGYRCVDEEIVARAAELEGLQAADVADVERRRSLLERLREELPDFGASPPPAERHRELIREAIHETADAGNVVILSHGGSIALAGREGLLRVLVTASTDTRELRVAEGLVDEDTERAIEDSDVARADYLERFYGVERELPTHYDLVLNTDVLTSEQAAAAVVLLAEHVSGTAPIA
jgi:cytidylate kinase